MRSHGTRSTTAFYNVAGNEGFPFTATKDLDRGALAADFAIIPSDLP
jgi:hypothetical protein